MEDTRPCSEHDREIASLRTLTQEHTREIDMLREKAHTTGNAVTVLSATLNRIEKTTEAASERFEKHMDREEQAFNKLYERIKSMDTELKESFEKRDEKIHVLDKSLVRMLAYATAAFAVVTAVSQYFLHAVLGV